MFVADQRPERLSDTDRRRIQAEFSPANLSNLSLTQYVDLWRRYPMHYVAHAMRYGIRDHWAIDRHMTGLGQFDTGFVEALKTGDLRSILGINLALGLTEESVLAAFGSAQDMTKRGSLENALRIFKIYTNPDYQDQNCFVTDAAIHLAANVVQVDMYGAETGNEIFIIFPSIFIAANYPHIGWLTTKSASIDNDVYVWPPDYEGIPLSAGIIFIAADARVDPTTGSRYLLDANNNPITTGVDKPGLHAGKIIGYRPADLTIGSQKFWNVYFRTHPVPPGLKVVYYTGDPNEAVSRWQTQMRLTRTSTDSSLGFPKISLGWGNPIYRDEMAAFRATGVKALEKYFASIP